MELVADAHGEAAPRLNDLEFSPEDARTHHERLIREVVRMLCAGVVHGDLSEYNILMGSDGPVIIDLPQAVDAAGNNHAPKILERDVANLRNYFGRYAPELLATDYGTGDLGAVRGRAPCSRTRRSPGASSGSRRPSISTA